MNIIYDSNPDLALAKATKRLNELFSLNKGRKILFLTSGGSAFKLLDSVDEDFLNESLTISVLDERADSDPAINNFAQLTQTEFYKKARNKSCSFIDTGLRVGESSESLSMRFEEELKAWKDANSSGVIISTLGMGSDGHTSGIMPFPEDPESFEKLFNQNGKWIISYDASGKNPYAKRVTTTLTFMITIDFAVAYVVGENKKEALERLAAEKGSLAETPARIWREMKDVEVFVCKS